MFQGLRFKQVTFLHLSNSCGVLGHGALEATASPLAAVGRVARVHLEAAAALGWGWGEGVGGSGRALCRGPRAEPRTRK